MLMTKWLYTVLLLTVCSFSFSQSNLPIGEDFSRAIQAKTRTIKGIPGIKYWQNRVSYNISAEVFPEQKRLFGEEKIIFENNSPDTLYQILLHIFQNLYKAGSPRDKFVHPDDVNSGVIIENLTITEREIFKLNTYGTLLVAELKDPVLPSEIITINVKWNFVIPIKSDIRMGGKDSSSFFLGQWYPKVAVYDDLKGWDKNLYTGDREFYYDLGNYEYTVKVPDGYIVWGSGLLQNGEMVLSDRIYNKFRQAQTSDSIISVVGLSDYQGGEPITRENIWKFKADNVSDVAFGTSDHFLWDATSTVISGHRVLIEAAYPAEVRDFTEVAELGKKSIRYLSTDLPGVPFPFPSMTIFNGTNGSSGMEYPMIVNNPSADNRGRTVDVTIHEITHSYFPFYVLTNETEHTWMDEAFAVMIPYKYQLENGPSLNRLIRSARLMSTIANTSMNIAPITNATIVTGRISHFTFYMKPAVALYILQDMLGKEMFKACLTGYMETWNGKHPAPADFFNSVNATSGQDLNWFWTSWFYGNGYPDLSIDHVEVKDDHYEVTIEKIGDLPVPVDLTVIYKDQTEQNIHQPAAIWENRHKAVIPIKTNKNILEMTLGNEYIPDTNPTNNLYTIK